MPIRQITIIGTGLIGGSLALALRRKKFPGRIIGCDRDATLERARSRGAIDDGTPNPSDAVRGSQLVVLATPVFAIVDLIDRIGPRSRQSCADRCGKHEIGRGRTRDKSFWEEYREAVSRRTSDGRERMSGVDSADADLFQKAVWFITPLPGQNMNEDCSRNMRSGSIVLGLASPCCRPRNMIGSAPGSAMFRRWSRPLWPRPWSTSSGPKLLCCRPADVPCRR